MKSLEEAGASVNCILTLEWDDIRVFLPNISSYMSEDFPYLNRIYTRNEAFSPSTWEAEEYL